MNREKQIEERNELVDLLEDIGRDWDSYIDECQENEEQQQISYEDFHADAILEAGYRKQEWISVDERLPEESDWYLVNIIDHFGLDKVTITNYTKTFGWNVANVTHWMPLPEAPKMKGGAE